MTKIESATLVQLTSSKLRIRHGLLYVFEQEMERDKDSEFRLAIPCHSMANANRYHLRMNNVLEYLLNATLSEQIATTMRTVG